MKPLIILSVFLFLSLLHYSSNGKLNNSSLPGDDSELSWDNQIKAINDTFYIVIGCGSQSFCGNVMNNDIVPHGMTANILQVVCHDMSQLTFGPHGNFAFNAVIGSLGLIKFSYKICDSNNNKNFSEALVFLFIQSDFDCDEVFDEFDLDDDNDGLLDSTEGNALIDTDYDGVFDVYDIDDDDDGIPDNLEWQVDGSYLKHTGIDKNKNGWDDVYENKSKTGTLRIADSDNDGIPDFRDTDSDNDSIPDIIEAYDLDFDQQAEKLPIFVDNDNDGLDDSFDTVILSWREECNSTGSKMNFLDENNNGIPNFREILSESREKEESFEFKITKFENEVQIYPNPSNGIFSINIPNYSAEDKLSVLIYNSNGQLKKQLIADNSLININMHEFPQGLYFVQINSVKIKRIQKIMIQF